VQHAASICDGPSPTMIPHSACVQPQGVRGRTSAGASARESDVRLARAIERTQLTGEPGPLARTPVSSLILWRKPAVSPA
jgi:hypothetical protein